MIHVCKHHRDFDGENRITELFELEGIFESHLVQPPCNEQGHAQVDQDAQGLVLKVSRDRASTTMLDNPFQYLTTVTVKDFSLISNLNLPSFIL